MHDDKVHYFDLSNPESIKLDGKESHLGSINFEEFVRVTEFSLKIGNQYSEIGHDKLYQNLSTGIPAKEIAVPNPKKSARLSGMAKVDDVFATGHLLSKKFDEAYAAPGIPARQFQDFRVEILGISSEDMAGRQNYGSFYVGQASHGEGILLELRVLNSVMNDLIGCLYKFKKPEITIGLIFEGYKNKYESGSRFAVVENTNLIVSSVDVTERFFEKSHQDS